MKTIVVTTDLSVESKAAFPLARTMAQTFSAKLMLLLVGHELIAVPTAYGLEVPVYFDPEVQKEINARMQRELDELRAAEFPAGVETIFKTGCISPVDGVIEAAAGCKADLLVMASHGRSGVRRVLIGSVTERVIREAPCPVLVVPVKSEK